MIIDFHTHIFPEKIARKTLTHLAALCDLTPSIDGTCTDLLRSMEDAGIDHSVILPVVTRPSQFDSILNFAVHVNAMEHFTSFAGLHPECEDLNSKLDAIVKFGLPGIKLHPDYQETYADDPRYVKIVDGAIKRDLIILFHAGVDIGLPDIHYSAPSRFMSLLDQVNADHRPEAKIVLAHTGGYDYWDEVYGQLAGRSVYMDMSFTMPFASQDQIMKIIEKHGADRILFATDCPWRDQKEYLELFRQLPLHPEDAAAILGGNARRLLHM